MGKRTNRKILFISYHFPPDSAVGAIRPAKFVKYLRSLGWEPYVLTIKEKYLKNKDMTRLAEIEDVPMIRTAIWPGVLELGIAARREVRKLVGISARGGGIPQDLRFTGNNPSVKNTKSTIKRYLNSLFELPDKKIGWLIPASLSAIRIIWREKIGILITSSPPRTTALVGLVASLMRNTVLVTDLRDPWLLRERKPAETRSWLGDRIEGWLEKRIIGKSKKIIVTTEQYRIFLEGIYPRTPKKKFATLVNGYDEEDFKELPLLNRNGKFVMSYIGSFYLKRTPKEVLEAIGDLVRDGIIPADEIEINFAGGAADAKGISIEELAGRYGLGDYVRIWGQITYKEALQVMSDSNVLLVFAPDQYYCIPAKVFEYLRAGKPILCLSEQGATAELVEATGRGIVVAPHDTEEIKKAIHTLYKRFRRGEEMDTSGDISMYERKALARKFSEIVESL